MKQKARTKKFYPHPFSAAYWKDAAAEHTDLRSLAFAALLCALAIIIEKFQIPIAPSLFISMSFPAISLCSLLTGPVLAIVCGIIVDVIGAIGSGYPFFAGYTLTAVLTAVIYALFFYRARMSFARVVLAKSAINLFVNTLLGSLWRIMLSGGMAYSYYVVLTGIKNLILLPLEVFLICVLFRALQKPLQQIGVLVSETELHYRKRDMCILCIAALIGAVLLYLFATHYDELKTLLQQAF